MKLHKITYHLTKVWLKAIRYALVKGMPYDTCSCVGSWLGECLRADLLSLASCASDMPSWKRSFEWGSRVGCDDPCNESSVVVFNCRAERDVIIEKAWRTWITSHKRRLTISLLPWNRNISCSSNQMWKTRQKIRTAVCSSLEGIYHTLAQGWNHCANCSILRQSDLRERTMVTSHAVMATFTKWARCWHTRK